MKCSVQLFCNLAALKGVRTVDPDSRLSDLSAVCVVPLYQTLVSRIDPGLYLESELPATHAHTHTSMKRE